MSWVPVVDLGGDPATVGRSLADACERVGFLSITNHGVASDVLDAAWSEARAFFDLTEQEKLRVAMPYPGYPYGYAPMGSEQLAASLGEVAPPDLKESFSIGPISAPRHRFADADEASVWLPNLWSDALPGMRPAWERAYVALAELSARLLSLMAGSLGLESSYFVPMIDRHASSMRAINYPVVEHADGQLRAGAHTDYGTVTVLVADPEVAGLEVLQPDGQWAPVAVLPGSLVVNLGDAMARWTNDRWRSTLHRVVPGARRRQSIAFFHNANWDALIECIPTCLEPGESPRHPPMPAGPHLMAKFRATVTPA